MNLSSHFDLESDAAAVLCAMLLLGGQCRQPVVERKEKKRRQIWTCVGLIVYSNYFTPCGVLTDS